MSQPSNNLPRQVLRRIVAVALATYNFFAGDAIVLAVVIIAFVLTDILEHVLAANIRALVGGIVFVALILSAITLTLGRERASAQRARRRAS